MVCAPLAGTRKHTDLCLSKAPRRLRRGALQWRSSRMWYCVYYMESRFIHLHVHSHYSFLQALPKIPELVNAAKERDISAIALTDTANMHGAIEFYKHATKEGIKPIIGVDLYVAPRSRFQKDPILDAKRSRIVLLAENNIGYKNLIALVTQSYVDGFFERPRVDYELLNERKDGIIALIPSIAGNVAQLIKAGDREGAGAALSQYKDIFGVHNVFLEISHHPKMKGHQEVIKEIIALSKEGGVQTVAQNDVYYIAPEDREPTEIMRRIQRGGEHGYHEDEDFSFTNEAQMLEYFKDEPEAVFRSGEIAQRCNVSFELGSWIFPDVPIDPKYKNHAEELRGKAYDGLKTRNLARSKEVEERIEYELSIINKKGFAPYFIAIADLLTFAKSVGILTATRGSAAGSLIGYLTGISNIDPLAYKLPFERFLNPGRPKAPDIDMDIADNRRDELIDYAKRRYGADKVTQIGTFGTMAARAAVRDVARALGHPYSVGDRIAKLIPIGSQGFPMTISRALELEPELKEHYKNDEDVRYIIDIAQRIEGCVRHVGVHAAGVVIAPTPLIEWIPLQPDPKGGKMITQYDMYSITDEYGGLGLLKFDFLGIKNLSILSDAIARINKNTAPPVSVDNIPIDDKKTFEMLARGETEGVFQLSGSGMTHWLKDLKPTTIHDINAMIALYRPGPMEIISDYIERKHNPKLVRYIDERMKEYLEFSHGLLVYQDDVLLTVIKLGGYSWLEADMFRKAMGKKIPAVMQAEKEKLMKGFKEYGNLSKEKSEKIWELIAPFAAYGFNKCLTADTRIINGDTGIPEHIDTLLKHNRDGNVCALGFDGRVMVTKRTAVRKNGTKDVFRMTTRGGRTIRATANHPFLSFSGWMRLDELTPGTRIATPRILPEPKKTVPMTHHEAVVLGYLIAEGNLCHPHGVYYYAKAEDEVKDFIISAEKFENANITIDRSKNTTSVYVGQKQARNGNVLRIWLDTLGLIGKKATEKSIPDVAFSVNNETLAVVLGKLWQGDGCVSRQNAQTFYATSSITLADDVQLLLTRFGIISTLHKKTFRYRGGHKYGYTVVVTGYANMEIFARTIGQHLLTKKQTALASTVDDAQKRINTLGRGTVDTVPTEVFAFIREAVSVSGLSTKECAIRAGLSQRFFGYDARKRGYTRAALETAGVALNSPTLHTHATSDIFWDEVISIVPDGHEMTYDISVPHLQNFVANGIVVHNSHAASYGRVSYQTAYFKANYPVEYMSAVLTADAGDTEKVAIFVAECERMNIPVLPPDINESDTVFTVVNSNIPDATAHNGKAIRFGLSSIKNFGEGISEAILSERTAHGPYTSLTDFLSRVEEKSLTRKSMEALTKSGALDSFGSRGSILANMETLLTFHRESTKKMPQDALFSAQVLAPTLSLDEKPIEISLSEKLEWEKELLGIYISGHPLDAHQDIVARSNITIEEILSHPKPGTPVILPVLVAEVRTILTKKGEKMAFVRFEDKTSSIEAALFPKILKENEDVLKPGICLLVKGHVSNRNGEISLAVDAIKKP